MIVFIVILITVAAICKALADTLDQHFDTSIFRNKPRKWYDPNVTIKSAPQIFGYPLDVWHITNSVQIFSWLGLMIIYKPISPEWWMDFIGAGILFNIVFNVFYNKIFR